MAFMFCLGRRLLGLDKGLGIRSIFKPGQYGHPRSILLPVAWFRALLELRFFSDSIIPDL